MKTLQDRNLLTKSNYLHLFSNSATLPLFYALIKTHKLGNPIRPIVSFIGSPSYNIAKFLSNLLTPSTNKSVHKLKNSFSAKEKLRLISIPDHYSLVSFEVKALFTSIPINYAILCVNEFLNCHKYIYDKTQLNSSKILKLVEI